MSERNLVKAPAHLDPVNSLGEQHQQQHSHSLGITPTFTTDMATMHLSRMSGRRSRKDSQDEMHDQDEDDGLEQESSGHESPSEFTGKQRASESFREDSLKISGVSQERLATSFPTSNQIGLPTSDNPPVSPATLSANVAVASTFSSPMSQGTQSSDQTLTETSLPRRTLRSGRRLSTAMTTRSTSSSWNLSDEGDTIAMDTDASQGEERELHAHLNTEANVQSDDHTMNTVGEDYQGVSRPSPRQGEGSLHHHHQSSQQKSVGGSELPIDEADAQGQYIRNLVGGVVVYGQQATDLDNEPQVWFAFSTISIRTEGYFRIRFRLTEIGSQDE
ncbi:hypothetical protein BGW42_008415 [Actinomortierella wolfii]|nr:hypothetical protein BGW42_008415 [Actinomortierella wolfii]